MHSLRNLLLLLFPAAAITLAGCGVGTPSGPQLNVASDAMQGRMYGGHQPVAGATISVYAVGSTAYGTASTTALASTSTDSNGFWGFASGAYTCPASNTPMYIVASGGNPGAGTNANESMMALVPQCSAGKSSYFWINEITTAAAVLAAGQFIGTGLGSANATPQIGGTCTGCAAGTYNRGLVNAFSNTYPTLVVNATGTAVPSGTTNGITVTREVAKLTSMANVLAACVNSTGSTSTTETSTICGQLFTDVNAKSASPRPYTTIQAALEMTLYPYYNVSNTFNLSGTTPPFGGGLSSAPNDWTLAISYASPNYGLSIAGTATSRTSSNIDIDANGNVWFPSNASGASGLAYFSPTSSTFNGPYITSLVDPQYLTIGALGSVFGTDLAGARLGYTSTTSPTAAGTVVATTSFTGPVNAQYSTSTTVQTVYLAAGGTSVTTPGTALYSYSTNRTTLTNQFDNTPQSPNGLVYDPFVQGTLESTSGSSTVCSLTAGSSPDAATTASPCYAGGIALTLGVSAQNYVPDFVMPTSVNQICNNQQCFTPPLALNAPEGIAVDGTGSIWIANSGNGSVSTFKDTPVNFVASDFTATSTVQYLHNTNNGGTMTTPFGVAVDGSGNVWLSNAGCVTTTSTACTPNGFTLSELIGVASPTVVPLVLQKNGNRGTNPFEPTN